MIYVTRLNGKQFVLNAELIEMVESTPDTVVTLMNGNKYVVSETPDEIIRFITKYRRCCYPLFSVEGEKRNE